MKEINYTKLKSIILTTYRSVPKYDESHLVILSDFYDIFTKAFKQTLANNGRKYTLGVFKSIHTQATCIAIQQDVKVIPFHKSGRDGISHLLRLVLPVLLSTDDKAIRLILTITRMYESIRLQPEFDPNPITDPYSGEITMDEFCHDFDQFLSKSRWFSKLTKLFRNSMKPSQRLIGRIRSGPNGQAIITSHYDAIALKRSPELYTNIIKYNVLCNQTFINKSLNFCMDSSLDLALGKVNVGKIALIAERAGKTRQIGLGDFWTQNSLQSLHDSLMSVLRTIVTDCTYDQDSGFFRIQRLGLKRKYIFSADLSKATDRSHVKLCKTVLYRLSNSWEMACLWESIITDRPFTYKGKDYKWSVGTPLGLLSGWALFSLTHHCLVQYSYWKTYRQYRFFTQYQILGDDITIWNKIVSRYYTMLLNKLGIEINKTKSMKSVPGNYRFEFAKRISQNGKELTGVSFDLLQNASLSIYDYVDFVRHMVNTKYFTEPLDLSIIPQHLSEKGKEYLRILLWESELLCPVLSGNIGSKEALSAIRRKILHLRLLRMKKISEELAKALGTSTIQEYFKRAGIECPGHLLEYTADGLHPIVESLNYTGMKLYECLSILQEIHDNVDLITLDVFPLLEEFEYMPLPHMKAHFERPKKKDVVKTKLHSELVLTAYNNLRPNMPVIVR